MLIPKDILLFQIKLNAIIMINTYKKLLKSSKAGAGTCKTCVNFREISLLFCLDQVFHTNRKKVMFTDLFAGNVLTFE